MTKGTKKGTIIVIALFCLLIITVITGMSRDKKNIEKNKILVTEYENDKKEKNNDYYLSKTINKLENNEDVLIIFAGDSVTYGVNATSNESNFVGLFSKWIAEQYPEATVIRADGKDVKMQQPITAWEEKNIQTGSKNTITIVNAGVPADSILQLLNRKDNFVSYNSKTPDCIFVMDGINDSDPNNVNRYSSSTIFKTLLSTFIDLLKEQTGADIAIMTSHWSGESPNSPINDYVEAQKSITNKENYLLIDNKSLWDNHYNSENPNHGQGDWLTADDHIHPTDIGYQAISDNIVANFYNTK